MAYLDWRPELEVGHAQIDQDHRTLVEALNRLHAALAQGQDRAAIVGVLNFLRDYAVTHFKTEEALIIRHNDPNAAAHFAAHSDLVMQVSDFIADFRSGKVVLAEDMLHFLETWLMDHIQGKDKVLGAFLQNRP